MDSASIGARITQEEQLLADTKIECSRAEWKLASLVDYSTYHNRVTTAMSQDLLRRRNRLNAEGTDVSGSRTLSALLAGLNATLQEGEMWLFRRGEQAQRIRDAITSYEEHVRLLKEQEAEMEESLVGSYCELAMAHEEEAMG